MKPLSPGSFKGLSVSDGLPPEITLGFHKSHPRVVRYQSMFYSRAEVWYAHTKCWAPPKFVHHTMATFSDYVGPQCGISVLSGRMQQQGQGLSLFLYARKGALCQPFYCTITRSEPALILLGALTFTIFYEFFNQLLFSFKGEIRPI